MSGATPVPGMQLRGEVREGLRGAREVEEEEEEEELILGDAGVL